MRLGDLDALFCRFWGKADPFKEQPLLKPSAVWSKAATMAREAPTIDPETLTVVRRLREELARVTAERDAAVEQLHGYCFACKHYTPYHNDGPCATCKHERACFKPWDAVDRWQWRGPQKKG